MPTPSSHPPRGLLWEGAPATTRAPLAAKLAAASFGATALVAGLFAWISTAALGTDGRPMATFAAIAALLAVATLRVPIALRSALRFRVTDREVSVRCGPFRRSIAREGITYARIVWTGPAVGDLVLVRAVATGALRRTLTLTLPAVAAPDQLLARLRGAAADAAAEGEVAATASLDPGETLLWTGVPSRVPLSARQLLRAAGAFALVAFAVLLALRGGRAVRPVLAAHALQTGPTVALIVALSLGVALVLAVGAGLAWASVLRPFVLRSRTRYRLTDRRLLITRGRELLSLDRRNIAYAIARESRGLLARLGLRAPATDVYLVLDGPRSRTVAAAGAFGLDDDGALVPVLVGVTDAASVRAILGA